MTCACTSPTTRADLASPATSLHATLRRNDQRQVCCLPPHLSSPGQQVWPGNDLQDPAAWDAPTLSKLEHVHEDLLQHYDCTDQLAAAQQAPPSDAGGSAAARGRKPAASARRLPGPLQRQTRSPATQPPPQGIQAESGFPPRRLPALRTSPLGPGPIRRNAVSPSSSPRNGPSTSASATRALVLRSRAAPPASEARGHGSGLQSPRRIEWAGGASRQCPGARPLLEAPLMARVHQVHIRQRCLRPRVVDHVCLHDARCGGSRAELPPSPQ